MKLGWILGIACAVLFHACILLFGGALFPRNDAHGGSTQEVELLSDVDEAEKDKPEDPQPEEDPIATDEEPPPDADEVIRSLEPAPLDDGPALEAASLSAIEAALNGQGGGGDFATALSFESGGRLGNSGRTSVVEQSLEEAFNLADIDQEPRAVVQGPPVYPNEMRGKKTEGVVTLIFVVDADGKVVNPRVEKSSHTAFENPALNAVKKWKFEPGLRGGARVACKMRIPIRFPPR